MDLLDKLRFRANAAVDTTAGYCQTREGQPQADVAFKLTRKAVISVPTATAFPSIRCLPLEKYEFVINTL